jgi:hypothetical protein
MQNLVGSAVGVICGVVAAAAYGSYRLLARPLLARYLAVTVLAYDLLPGAAGLLVLLGTLAILGGVVLLAWPTTWFPRFLFAGRAT